MINCSIKANVAADISMNDNTLVCAKVPFREDLYHTKTNMLICNADQLTGLWMMWVFERSDFQTIYNVSDFYSILWHTAKLNTIKTFYEAFKIQKCQWEWPIELIVYLWLNFSILGFKSINMIKCVIIAIMIICSIY